MCSLQASSVASEANVERDRLWVLWDRGETHRSDRSQTLWTQVATVCKKPRNSYLDLSLVILVNTKSLGKVVNYEQRIWKNALVDVQSH